VRTFFSLIHSAVAAAVLGSAVFVFLALPSTGMAQIANTSQVNHPEWNGLYLMVTGKDRELYPPLNNGVRAPEIRPDEIDAAELSQLIIPRLQPWAKLKMEATIGPADDTGAICQPRGPFRYVPYKDVGAFMWLSSPDVPDKVLMIPGGSPSSGVSRIYLNQQHPRNWRPTWNGHSIGHWEGDTLLIDTIGFNDKSWLHSSMEPHTEELHVKQRIRMAGKIGDADVMEIEWTVSDRKALTSAYSFTRYFKRTGQKERPENVCDDLAFWKQWRREALDEELKRAWEVK
jgi:hypothetical protein